MTRLSDSLRGLADRAPVDEVGVSTSAATRRIYRGRRLRAAANATAGVGLVAVIALAAVNPGMGSADSSTASAASAPSQAEGSKVTAPGFDATGAMPLPWGECGTRPFDADVPAVSDKFSLTLGEIGAEVDQGATIDVPVTITLSADVTSAYNSEAPAYLVLWDGVVVGTGKGSPTVETQSLEDHTAMWDGQLDLVNCWDGTPLPPGGYELVAYQDFSSQSTEPAPTAEPAPLPTDPTLSPVAPTVSPDAPNAVDGGAANTTVTNQGAPNQGAPNQGAPDQGAASSDGGSVAGNTGVVDPAAVDPAAVDPAERAVSNTVKFVVAGDVQEDPFGAYLSPAAPAVVYPDDYLTPAAARDEYSSRATTGTWDMAAGSQRVVKTGDSLTGNDQNAWIDSYYGCSADGTSEPSFPATSADWPLLTVDATLPGSVGVSYGWVIDGNPEVKVSVKNVSGHTLPGFWGQPNTTMYLVKDGKVVATSYLTPTDPNGFSMPMSSDGMLAPDASLSGTYLWRDVNGCWLGNEQATLKPGTYTVLMEQDVYLDNGNSGSGGPIVYLGDKRAVDGGIAGVGIAGVGTADAGTAEAPAIAGGPVTAPQGATADAPSVVAPTLVAPTPTDGSYDWLSLQVWTSLGRVTVK